MEITAREAARRLGERHRLSRDLARRVLTAGLAGPARRTPGALLYDEQALEALMDRPLCDRWDLDHWRPLIVRLGRERRFHADDSWEQTAAVTRTGWYLTGRVHSALRARPSGRLPLVATLGGFLVFAADIVAARLDDGPFTPTRTRPHPTSSFDLEPPDYWWGDLEGSWLPINNGPTWTLWGAPTSTPRIDSLRADVADQRRRLEIAEMTTSTWSRRAAAARSTPSPVGSDAPDGGEA
jgi:hypothetical protein